MNETTDELEELLADKPDLEETFETLLDIDAAGPWEFDDVPLDSGTFGEVVSRGIVEKVDGEYRLADPDGVRAVLEGEPSTATQTDHSGSPTLRSVPFDADWQALRPLAVGLVVIFLARVYMYPQVFRPEAITLLGNDPYMYRYLLLELARDNAGVFAVTSGIKVGEPLLVSTLWTITAILGGAKETGFGVLAWYPVGAALINGVFVYFIAMLLTRDRRVALAALVLLAVTPIHATGTALGFSDHHAFDLVWLALTMTAITWLAMRPDRAAWKTGLAIAGVAIGVSGQVLAWNAGGLLLVPIALYGVIHAGVAVRDDQSVVRALGPVTLGVAIGALLSWVVHLQAGWQSQYMVLTPTLLAGGLLGVLAVAEVGRRLALSAPVVGAGLLGVGIVSIVVTSVVFADFTGEAVSELTQLVAKTGQEEIAEVKSIFSTDYGFIAGPFFFFGVSLFFALPYLFWGFWHGVKRSRPAWVAAGAYGLVFFILGVIRVRFANQLALIAAVFSGLAFVHIYAVVTEGDRPNILAGSRPQSIVPVTWNRPERSTVFALVGVFLLVGGLGAMMTPLRVNLLTYDQSQYDAAMYMDRHADEQDLEYPGSYVFSEWGENRMYNALVSGESRSYGYARANYQDFITSPNGSQWYDRLTDRGYIVTTDIDRGDIRSQALQTQLHRYDGRETSHYRLLYASEDESVKVFSPVAGATITGTAEGNRSVSISGEMDAAPVAIPAEWSVRTDASGQYTVDIPTPGTYRIGEHRVTVNESAVRSGQKISLS